ncbi:MAG: hypothetical protein JWM16_4449 [Verrucomicrobiales bacterium]|nr:hypothetical protein [Verrucomicrobiales bacterium]
MWLWILQDESNLRFEKRFVKMGLQRTRLLQISFS